MLRERTAALRKIVTYIRGAACLPYQGARKISSSRERWICGSISPPERGAVLAGWLALALARSGRSRMMSIGQPAVISQGRR